MAEANRDDRSSSGLGFLAYMAICLIVLIAAAGVWMLTQSRGKGPEEPLVLPSEPEYAEVAPIPLAKAADRIALLDDDAAQFTYRDDPGQPPASFPGYVYALARLATLAGRPTRVWEAAVLSRMAFEIYYSSDKDRPLLSDLFTVRSVNLFLRNAGLETEQLQSRADGPLTVDDAEAFLRQQLAAGRPVLFDHFEWGLYIGEEQRQDKLHFVAIGSSLRRQYPPEQAWRSGGWWRRPLWDWVHCLVAVTNVYKQRDRQDEIVRAAAAASSIAARTRAYDVGDLPPSYRKQVRAVAPALHAYSKLAEDVKAGKALEVWLAGFSAQRVRFGRHAAAVYFADAAQRFDGPARQHLQEAADAFHAEYQAWNAYLKLGLGGDAERLSQKADHVDKAQQAYIKAIGALRRFYSIVLTGQP